MVRVAVCDDEKETTTELKLELASIFDELAITHEIDGFFSASELCLALKGGACYNLIFLDIAFSEDEMNGVEVGWLIREVFKDNAVSIVYISWVERFAMHLFQIRPMDFLIKPLTREKIVKTVKTYLKVSASSRSEGKFFYKKGHTLHSVQIKQIVYLEALDRKVIIHLCDGGKDDFYGTLKDVYEEQLTDFDFLFTHASFVVNYDFVMAINYGTLDIMGRSTPLPISKNRRDAMRKRYSAIMRRRRV